MVVLLYTFASFLGLSTVVQGAASVAQGGRKGAVASEVAVCSEIGAGLLRRGGNAADAIIGASLCVGVIDSFHSGIGGGGFALVRAANGKYDMIDFREMAPALANETMYSNNTDKTASTIGGLSVGIPGELRGFEAIHKYGRLPWAELFKPAIKLARDGFNVTRQLAINLRSETTATSTYLISDPTFAAVYAPHGQLVSAGDTIYRPTYARTLQAIADHGPAAFYNPSSPIAKATINAIQSRKGIMTLDDLASYKIEHRTPSHINYRGYKIHSTVAPSSGAVALSALNTLSGYDLDYVTVNGSKRDSNLTTHRMVEAMKFAYGQRTVLGDPAFTSNVTSLQLQFLTPETGAKIRKLLTDNSTHGPSYYDPQGYEINPTPGTSHLVAADKNGLVVSMTTTINLFWGSKIMVNETGVVLNNEMDDFSSPGSSNAFGYISTPINYIRPGKRPLSSISPVIVEKNGKFVFAAGSAGGSRIITANIQNTRHLLEHGLSIQEAIASPRLHDQIIPLVTTFETSSPSQNVVGYDNSTVEYLRGLGHNISFVAPGLSTAAGVTYGGGLFEASADPRFLDSGVGYV